ncbi:MAG TPA: hypothetical protein PLA50_13165 [Bacteroidia bacterium]|nr:hypothetical protein [Bacteroidia bacterium]
MNHRATATKLGLVLLAVLLVAGFWGILDRRFAAGDFYPHYASFRADPLGTSVLYEALDLRDGVAVSRNFTHLNTVRNLDGDTALLLLGYPRDGLDDLRAPESSPVLKAVKDEGLRLVVTLNPQLVPAAFRPEREGDAKEWIERRRKLKEEQARKRTKEDGAESGSGEKAKSAKPAKADDAETEKARIEEEIREVLGPLFTKKFEFEVTTPSAYKRPDAGWQVEPGEAIRAAGAIAEWPVWHSQYRFDPGDAEWEVVLSVDDEAVLMQRPYGQGTIVVASDSYFLSNQNLHLRPEPEFLLWLLGGKSKVVFDETIHGTTETGGAMKLIRRYRAHGVFFGLIVFFGLWAWRSASPLVPGSEGLDRGMVGSGGAVMGEEAGSGLIRLLRRSIPSPKLLESCVDIWRCSVSRSVSPAEEAEIARLLERQRREPKQFGIADAYRAIVDLLRKR